MRKSQSKNLEELAKPIPCTICKNDFIRKSMRHKCCYDDKCRALMRKKCKVKKLDEKQAFNWAKLFSPTFSK